MAGSRLETVDWRLERADEHLATLDHERRVFLDDEHRRVVGQFDRDAGEYVFRLEGNLPDPRLGILVGEFGHHLRAALDNLVWQLVLLRGGAPTRRTEFPIYPRREGYRANARHALRGISADDRAVIDDVQSYNLGSNADKAYLTLLAWLNNVDKHRVLHVGCMSVRTFPGHIVQRTPKGLVTGRFPWYPSIVQDIAEVRDVRYAPFIGGDDRAELARAEIVPNGPDPQMEMQGDLRLDVVLSDPQGAINLNDLHQMRGVVGAIVDAFRPRFNR